MAVEYSNDGIKKIHAGCWFENGSPVNSEHWDRMKKLTELVGNGRYLVNYELIDKVFNRVLGLGGQVHSKDDRFKIFCKENKLRYEESHEYRGYIVTKALS